MNQYRIHSVFAIAANGRGIAFVIIMFCDTEHQSSATKLDNSQIAVFGRMDEFCHYYIICTENEILKCVAMIYRSIFYPPNSVHRMSVIRIFQKYAVPSPIS